jgi:UDP-galactopyranose mutase
MGLGFTMKILVVGAGFAGAVAARELAEAGHEVLVIDKRNHIGGNTYDFINEHGIRIHKYGPHLWHTNNDEVQEWVSRFTEWVPYKHWVHALLPNGQPVPFPINRKTIETVFAKELEEFGQVGFVDIDSFTAYDLSALHKLLFAPYTKKMWGMELPELPVPDIQIKTNYDPYLSKDKHQFLPKDGYAILFKNIFDHQNITVVPLVRREELPQYADPNGYVRFIPNWEDVQFDAVFTSEPIDAYYSYIWGELPWRSIKFHTYSIPMPKAQSAPVVNFTHDGLYTRSTEWKQLPNSSGDPCWTTITIEEPCDYRKNNKERFYPMKIDKEVHELNQRYQELAVKDGVHFIGRCGMYTYMGMDECIATTLVQIRRFIAGDFDEVN